MNEWIQKQIDSGFSDLQGLSISARIPVKDRLVNELVAEALRQASAGASPAVATQTPTVDFRPLLRLVRKAEVHATDGTIVLDVDIRV